ncbi:MAG: hypothetical protein LBQ94_02435 [Treponema sp.]|nr:hypothetical protein [Treponema sp.]
MAKEKAKPTTKKPTAKKSAATAKTKPKAAKPTTRRPDANLPPHKGMIQVITNEVLGFINDLDDYAANLRALDRQRHNGVGLKRQGFIEAALRLSTKFPQYFPHWLSTAKFKADLDFFNAVRSLVEVCRSLEEKAWNINVEASDMVYTDALEYYAQVQDAAERRIDSAESIYAELHDFFRRGPMEGDQPTQKKIKRDVDALLHGRKDGEVIIKNVKPKTSGGTHEVIDETFRDTASFKETKEGDITE